MADSRAVRTPGDHFRRLPSNPTASSSLRRLDSSPRASTHVRSSNPASEPSVRIGSSFPDIPGPALSQSLSLAAVRDGRPYASAQLICTNGSAASAHLTVQPRMMNAIGTPNEQLGRFLGQFSASSGSRRSETQSRASVHSLISSPSWPPSSETPLHQDISAPVHIPMGDEQLHS
jgi:hypothetical protein